MLGTSRKIFAIESILVLTEVLDINAQHILQAYTDLVEVSREDCFFPVSSATRSDNHCQPPIEMCRGLGPNCSKTTLWEVTLNELKRHS